MKDLSFLSRLVLLVGISLKFFTMSDMFHTQNLCYKKLIFKYLKGAYVCLYVFLPFFCKGEQLRCGLHSPSKLGPTLLLKEEYMYAPKGSNSGIFIFDSLLNGIQLLKDRLCCPKSIFFLIKVDPFLNRLHQPAGSHQSCPCL